jgi:hypothetical protein
MPQSRAAVTDRAGAFVLSPLSPDTMQVLIRASGFQPAGFTVRVLPDSTRTVKVQLVARPHNSIAQAPTTSLFGYRERHSPGQFPAAGHVQSKDVVHCGFRGTVRAEHPRDDSD